MCRDFGLSPLNLEILVKLSSENGIFRPPHYRPSNFKNSGHPNETPLENQASTARTALRAVARTQLLERSMQSGARRVDKRGASVVACEDV